MAKGFAVTTEGVKEVQTMFKVLPKRTANKIVPKALKRAAKVVVKSAKSKVDTSIRFKFKPNKDGIAKEVSSKELKKIAAQIRGKAGNKYIIIGVKVAKKDPFYNLANWMEFGTLARRTEPLVKSRSIKGQAKASAGIGLVKHPFMRPAFLETKNEVQKIFKQEVLLEIPKEVEKILVKGKV